MGRLSLVEDSALSHACCSGVGVQVEVSYSYASHALHVHVLHDDDDCNQLECTDMHCVYICIV